MIYKIKEKKIKFYRLEPTQVLALGFAAVILTGALLLMLPLSSRNGTVTNFLDCLFTSTSATCVTGLVTVDTGTHWSVFGQVIIMMLIETGGLGFMTFATIFAVLLGRRITLKERLIMQEAYNAFNIQGIVKLALYIIGITLTIEGIGAAALATQFIPEYGWIKGIYFGIFHAVSAFCNAGFDIIGDFKNLTPYVENVVVNVTICSLIVIGGLGFIVITEIINLRKIKHLSLHSKVVLTATTILVVGGAVLMFIFEYNNPKTLGSLSFNGKILASFFASITPRTAGFNTISTTDMTTAGKFLTIILMFIGASPGSTGGGIKTTTASLLFMTVLCVIHGREDTEIFQKRIGKQAVYRAAAIAIISFELVLFVTMILSLTQPGTFIQFLYETTSAFGTVGLSLGLTPNLRAIGKVAITLTMYAGRVGPLTLAFAFARKANIVNSNIRYPEDKILVG